MQILGLTHIPDLSVEVDEGEKQYLAEKEFICGTQCPYLQVGFKDVAGKVKLLLYDIPKKPGSHREDAGLKATVLAGEGGNRPGEPLRLALGGSLAMGLARMQESFIKDDRLFFGQVPELTPDEFRRALRQHGLFKNIQEAAQQMFFQKPLSAFEPEALRALQLEEQMDKIVVEMLGLVKVSKKVDEKLFSKFYSLLDEALAGKRLDEERKKNLIGLLLLIHEYMLEESKKLKDPEPLYRELNNLKKKMEKMGLELP